MMTRVERLPEAFGAIVRGLNLSAEISDEALSTMLDLLVEHRFIVVPGQSLSNEEYVAFGRRWGRPVILVSSDNRLNSHPEMIIQSNSTEVPQFFRNVANHWHCDSSYEEEVSTFTMLYGIESPDEGGETMFADLVAAYEALPEVTQKRLDGLVVQHATSAAQPLPDEFVADLTKMPAELKRNVKSLDPVRHPLVQSHPVNGRKALYGLGGSCYGISGMDPSESRELLLELRRHVTQPQFVARYKLMPGDVLIWDNFSVTHRATPIEYSDEPRRRRLNYRISVKGLPSFYDA